MDNPSRTQQAPAASPAARWIAILIGILFLVLAGLAGYEIANYYQHREERSILKPALEYVGTVSFQTWMFYAGIVACLVALWLLVIVFKPRAKTHRPLTDSITSVWMRPIDIARMLSAHAEKVPGVAGATTTVGKRSIDMKVTGTRRDDSLGERVAKAVGPLASQLDWETNLDIDLQGPKEVAK